MGRPHWTSLEQYEWLEKRIPRYHECQKNGTLANFWGTVMEAWYTTFPDAAGFGEKGKSRKVCHHPMFSASLS